MKLVWGDVCLGLFGELKNKKGIDVGGRKFKGKGVYQFVNKYGVNVDGYSLIYVKDEWSKGGDSYVGGKWMLVFCVVWVYFLSLI